MSENKDKILQDAMKQIEKQYGKGSVMKLGDKAVEKVEVIPSGSIALDKALGVGGYLKDVLLKSLVLKVVGKQRLLCMRSLKHKARWLCRIH